MKDIAVNTVKPEVTFFENDTYNRLLEIEVESNLDGKLKIVEDYMKENPGHGLSEIEKDIIYARAQELFNEYKNELRDAPFNLYLNRTQYNFLTNLLLQKLEYDVNTVFIAIELTEFLGKVAETKYKNDTEIKCFPVSPTELTYIYHLIQSWKVKGLTREAYTFAKLLTRIGDLSKIINYYDAFAKNLVEEIQKWALRMDASDVKKETSLEEGTIVQE